MSRENRQNNTEKRQKLDLVEGCYIHALDLKLRRNQLNKKKTTYLV